MSVNGSAVVLGGTGFVGRHACTALSARGFDVLAVARGAPPSGEAGRFLAFDVARQPPEDLAKVLDELRTEVVVNAVGSIWGRTDEEMWDAVTVPTLRLLDALALLSAPPRIVHLGSVLEYGRMSVGTTASPATVERPGSAYGRAKLAATLAVLERLRSHRLRGVVLRITNLAGPLSPDVSLLGRVANQLWAAAGEPAVVELDPLLAHRDFVDVRDVADAVVAAATSPVTGELINIGSGTSTSVRVLVSLLVARSGLAASVVERAGTGIQHSTEDWSRVDIEPAERLLGWRPRRRLTDAVDAFWQEFVARHHPPNRTENPLS
ncbi:NAD-dependent epimerase/dehydratase family protein [Streptomyces sp. NPDC088261]|uniref:NAD-dependent epimerase/dehydratase family protein n=1 Tax=Streptomyces sp. NPDC088261 TaxID=3365851 RepID=UPI003818C5E9